MIDRLYTSFFGIGFIKKAPGTFGSLPGLALGYFLSPLPLLVSVGILILLTAIAYLAVERVEKHLSAHDPSEVVIDEVIGQAIAVLWIGPGIFSFILAFCFFRFFDILKPGPIGWIDRKVKGPLGTLGDDMLAGVFAGAATLGVEFLIERFF